VNGNTNQKVASVNATSDFIDVNPVSRLAYPSDSSANTVHGVRSRKEHSKEEGEAAPSYQRNLGTVYFLADPRAVLKIKMAPFLGPRSRGYRWWAMSGKAMHDAVPPARTAFKEVTQVEESEGHVAF
jgi:hypothetical protein